MRARILFWFSILSLAATCGAQNIAVEKYKLSNGMIVILHPDHSIPLATVNIWYRVGSKDEPPHHSGFAHLFEHLMFMGTRRVPTGEFDKIMESGGGNNNASTAEDRTNFYDVGPSNLLPTLLWLEADRLEELGKSMTLKKLNLQREVVKNERRQNTENTPYGSAYEAINGLMFPPGHPYHTSVIGSMADLDRAGVADVQKFFETYYVPNNASMVVAGDFDPAKLKPLIQSYFGTLPRRPPVVRKHVPALPPLGVKLVTMKDKVSAPKVIMVWHSPPAYRQGDVEMELTGSVLSSGLTSRLFHRLVSVDKLATDVSAFQEERLLGSLFYVDVTASEGASLKKLEAAIDSELAKFRSSGPTLNELKRQAAKFYSGTLDRMQSLQTVADSLNDYEYYLGRPNAFKEELDWFQNRTPEEVREVAAKVLDPHNRLILTVVPGSAVTPAAQGSAPERFATQEGAQDPRDVRPPVGQPKTYVAPLPVELSLSNGMKFYYWQKTELPLMTLSLDLHVGALTDPPARAGISALTSALLGTGGGSRKADEFQDALELLGASLDPAIGRISTTVSLNVPSQNFGPALKLYADAVLRPRLSQSDFERTKRVEIAQLEQEKDDVGVVSGEVAAKEFFGDANPYGRQVSGTPETLRSIDLAAVRRLYQTDYQPSIGVFYGAGSLPPKTVLKALNEQFGHWTSAAHMPAQPPVTQPAGLSSDGPKIVIVDKPGAPQTAIRFLMPAPNYSSPDRLALEEIGTILGGSFTSRLNQNLREDKGYTYGASAGFVNDLNVGYLVASAEVRADVTGAAIKEFLSEFDKIRAGDITDAEVSKATATIRAETIDGLGSIQGIVGGAVGLANMHRPFAALGQDDQALGAITAQQLNKLVKTQINYKSGVLVLVGDKATIEAQMNRKD